MSDCDIVTISPEEYKTMKNFTIEYGWFPTKFGNCLMGLNEERACFVGFSDSDKPNLTEIERSFPEAKLVRDDDKVKKQWDKLFEAKVASEKPKVLVKGTEFQTSVWKELVNVKAGTTSTYSDIAKALGNPKAVRAVAKAVASNNVSYLIPCHRVVGKGGISKYRWGAQRKIQMLKDEKAL